MPLTEKHRVPATLSGAPLKYSWVFSRTASVCISAETELPGWLSGEYRWSIRGTPESPSRGTSAVMVVMPPSVMVRLMLEEPDPQAALDNFRNCLEKINSQENYDYYKNCGFPVIYRDENRTIEQTLALVEKSFKLDK